MRRETLTLVTAKGPVQIDTEVTETLEEMQRGLMFRTHLAEKAGMLFTYDRPREVTMWMENTHIPLDMIFIRADGVVHRIEAWTEPFSRKTIPRAATCWRAWSWPAARPSGWASSPATGSSIQPSSPARSSFGPSGA